MRRYPAPAILFTVMLAGIVCGAGVANVNTSYDKAPPFGLGGLRQVAHEAGAGGEGIVYGPKNPYNIFINYELGMHCVGFDISYCCIIPPYNSVQAQAVRSAIGDTLPDLLSRDDKVHLSYAIRDNTYSEGNKMRYLQVAKDVSGTGTMANPGDNMANYVWTHLFIYKDLEGTLPDNPEKALRRHIGKEIPVNIDSGPSGKPVSGGDMDYAKEKGGNIVFTDSLLPGLANVPITLTSSRLWDALGLPLTAFCDSARKGSIRTITDADFQPFQYAFVRLADDKGQPVLENGKPVEFFGTEPVDISICATCHSGQGVAANFSRGAGLKLFDKEYVYWKTKYPDTSEYIARQSSASILVLELHDRNHKTSFLKNYNPEAPSNRLGRSGPVHCADCHGDNMSGVLKTPRPGMTGYPGMKAKPLTEAIHTVHARFIRMPDKAGRTQSCQACHPSHWQNPKMNHFETNPYQITDTLGNPRFSSVDLRVSGGGCYLRRDAHSNPHVKPPFFLNDIGKWYLNEVSMKDEAGNKVKEIRGLYCTNCHNNLTHELYGRDDLSDTAVQEGKTLRNKPVKDVIKTLAAGDEKRFKAFFADPVVERPGRAALQLFCKSQGSPSCKGGKG